MLSAGLVAIGLPLADPIIPAQRGHGSTLLAAMHGPAVRPGDLAVACAERSEGVQTRACQRLP